MKINFVITHKLDPQFCDGVTNMLRKFAGTMIVQKEKRNSPERFQISGNFKAFGKLSEITKYVLVFFYFLRLSSL